MVDASAYWYDQLNRSCPSTPNAPTSKMNNHCGPLGIGQLQKIVAAVEGGSGGLLTARAGRGHVNTMRGQIEAAARTVAGIAGQLPVRQKLRFVAECRLSDAKGNQRDQSTQ